MKKIAALVLILFIVPIISAVELDMKSEFKQGETFMARVSGNFLDLILEENIFFYREHVRTPMIFDVQEIEDEFYIYAQLLDKAENNYSIVIKNARYMDGGKISEQEIRGNFSIIPEQADFSISPGFVFTEDDFFIEVQNLQDYKISIQSKTSSEDSGFLNSLFGSDGENLVDLKSGEIKKINFELGNITQSALKIIELSTENLKYEIPIYVFVENKSGEELKSFRFEPSNLNISMATNSSSTRIIYLRNTGEQTLENISLSVSDSLSEYLSLSINEIETLEKNSSIKIEFSLSSDWDEKKIQGQITAKENGNFYSYSSVFLNFIKDYIPEDEEEPVTSDTCAELGGEICEDNEECDEEINAQDGVCCLGNCEEIKKSSTGKIIGWIIIIGIIGFLVWFFKQRYKGVK